MLELRTKRLGPSDRELAKQLFAVMATIFEEDSTELSDTYVDRLLSRTDFWVIAALAGDDVIGGITGHVLPMTRTESPELFIYDIAVRADYQRRGIGRRLMTALREGAASVGIDEMFVPADNDDTHALDFYRALGGAASPVTFFTFPTCTGDERKT
jgi:aminoglycoside 3-N-acetyltransferase I